MRPTFWLGNVLWKVGDIKIIDGLIDGTAEGVYGITQRAVRLQTGYVYHYAFAMLIGVALLVTYFMFMRRSCADGSSPPPRCCRSSRSCRWSARVIIAFLNHDAKGNARWVAL